MFQPDLFTKDTVAEGATLAADIVTLRVEQGQGQGQAAAVAWPANDEDLDLPAVLGMHSGTTIGVGAESARRPAR